MKSLPGLLSDPGIDPLLRLRVQPAWLFGRRLPWAQPAHVGAVAAHPMQAAPPVRPLPAPKSCGGQARRRRRLAQEPRLRRLRIRRLPAVLTGGAALRRAAVLYQEQAGQVAQGAQGQLTHKKQEVGFKLRCRNSPALSPCRCLVARSTC